MGPSEAEAIGTGLDVDVGHVVFDDRGARCPAVEEGGEVLAALGQVVTLDVGLDAGDSASEAVGGRLADVLPPSFGGVEDGSEGVGLSECGAAVSAAGVGVGRLALGLVDSGAEFVAGPGIGTLGGVLPTAPAGVQVSEVVL